MRALLCLLLLFSSAIQAIVFDSASFLDSNTTQPSKLNNNTHWQSYTLPDNWDKSRPRRSGHGWYKVDFEVHADKLDQAEPWAVYLPRISDTIEIFLNNKKLGDSGRFSQPLARNWLTPQFFEFHPSLLNSGNNTLLIRIAGYANSNSGISKIYLDKASALKPSYAWRYGFLITTAQVTSLSMLILFIAMLGFWWLRRQDTLYLWFSLSCLCGSLLSLNWFWRDTPFSYPLWESFWNCMAGWYIYCLMMFVHRFIGLQRPRIEKTYACIAGLATLIPAALGEHGVLPAANFFHALNFSLSIYIVGTLYIHRRQTSLADSAVVLSCLFLCQLAGLHDWVMQTLAPSFLDMNLFHLSPLLMSGALLWLLLSRLFRTLSNFEQLNDELQQRVEKQSAQVINLEKQQAISEERQRIMLDLHDGMGGQLVSALSYLEADGDCDSVLHNALSRALQDLRLMVDSLDEEDGDILTLLGMLRERLEPLLNKNGLRFIWQVEDEPQIPVSGPSASLQLMRILQEAITNTVKHANADNITVRTTNHSIELQDNGDGLPPEIHHGHGINSMQMRAQRLQAKLDLHSSAKGTRLTLSW